MPGETLLGDSSSVDDGRTKRPTAQKAGCSSTSADDTAGVVQILLILED